MHTCHRNHCRTNTQALAYFLQAMLTAAIGFRAPHLKHPRDMLRRSVTTVRRAWAIHGHRPTSLPAEVCEVSAPYYGDGTNHMVYNAYTAHTAAQLHRLMRNQESEGGKVFTLTLREAQQPSQHVSELHIPRAQPSHRGGNPCMEPRATPAATPPACHSNGP